MTITSADALLIVDVQVDFCPGGALAVPDGDAVVPVVNGLAPYFNIVVATQDWHPPGHVSFASSHPGSSPGEVVELPDGAMQVVWPDHCVQESPGAAFHPQLDTAPIHYVVRKGHRPGLDSYSGFAENDRKTNTGLDALLRGLDVRRVFIAGLATDYCVHFTATDAIRCGFETVVVSDACHGINQPAGSLDAALKSMRDVGVSFVTAGEVDRTG